MPYGEDARYVLLTTQRVSSNLSGAFAASINIERLFLRELNLTLVSIFQVRREIFAEDSDDIDGSESPRPESADVSPSPHSDALTPTDVEPDFVVGKMRASVILLQNTRRISVLPVTLKTKVKLLPEQTGRPSVSSGLTRTPNNVSSQPETSSNVSFDDDFEAPKKKFVRVAHEVRTSAIKQKLTLLPKY